MQEHATVLKCDKIMMRFGGLIAVNDFALELSQGELVGLIGPNGAGKTTVFNMITGVHEPSSRDIYFLGEKSRVCRPILSRARGLRGFFQNIRLFGSLPVLDNIMLAQHLRLKSDPFSAVFRLPWYVQEEKAIYEDSLRLLDVAI